MGREVDRIDHSAAAGLLGEGKGEGLKNSVVFTWGFVEMVLWFWVGPFFSFLLTLRGEELIREGWRGGARWGVGRTRTYMDGMLTFISLRSDRYMSL